MSLFAGMPTGRERSDPTCSRAGCSGPASWNVNWRNPRIHGPERIKVWLACDEHRDYLHDYLAARDFPVIVTAMGHPLDHLPNSVADGGIS